MPQYINRACIYPFPFKLTEKSRSCTTHWGSVCHYHSQNHQECAFCLSVHLRPTPGLSLTTNHGIEPVWDDLVLQCLFIRPNWTSGISPFFLILSPQASLHNCPSPWQLRSLQSSQRQKRTHWSYWNLHGAFSKLCSSSDICTFVGLFSFFINTKTVQLPTPQNLTPPDLTLC